MEKNIENADAWVVARLSALERANRRLTIGVAALFTTLVSLGIAGGLFAAHFELPEGAAALSGETGSLRVDDLEVRNALRVVDDSGRNLVWLGRETPKGGAPQVVFGLFAAADSAEPQQTVRIATSRLGSALSLSSLDGSTSSSLFAGATGVSLELRRGASTATYTDKPGPGAGAAPLQVQAPPPAPPIRAAGEAGAPAAPPLAESDAVAARSAADGTFTVDLTNPTLQSLGSGFLVGPTSVTDSGGGLRVRGRIVNTTSVDQARAEFRLGIGKREVSFSVARVGAGGSAPFAVELPENGKADVRAARMRWLRSSVRYGEE
jgi:hypothetical protein